jgi:hypothetical protein
MQHHHTANSTADATRKRRSGGCTQAGRTGSKRQRLDRRRVADLLAQLQAAASGGDAAAVQALSLLLPKAAFPPQVRWTGLSCASSL